MEAGPIRAGFLAVIGWNESGTARRRRACRKVMRARQNFLKTSLDFDAASNPHNALLETEEHDHDNPPRLSGCSLGRNICLHAVPHRARRERRTYRENQG